MTVDNERKREAAFYTGLLKRDFRFGAHALSSESVLLRFRNTLKHEREGAKMSWSKYSFVNQMVFLELNQSVHIVYVNSHNYTRYCTYH